MKMEYGTEKVSKSVVDGKKAMCSPSLPTASLEISRIALKQFSATVSITVGGVVPAVMSKMRC